jgi:hypothetical protein
MWSSITYSPVQLTRAMAAGKVWRKPLPLLDSERAPVTLADGPPAGGPTVDNEPVETAAP